MALGEERVSASVRAEAELISGVHDPFARSSLRVAYHLRRYVAVYVLGTLGLLTLAILPTVGNAGSPQASGPGTGIYGAGSRGGASSGSGAPGSSGALGDASGGPAIAGSGGAGGGAGEAGGGAAGAAGSAGGAASAQSSTVQVGAGVTRGGFPCKPGVAQLPFSKYAAPCVAKFSGNNGGATYRGVTGDTITFAVRKDSDANSASNQAINAEIRAAGGADPATNEGYIKAIIAYFNKTFELYGRHVTTVDFNGQGNGSNESLGTGQAAACADADTVANSLKAFSDINYGGIIESEPFANCAALHYHLPVLSAQPYYPESEFQAEDPYVWGITPSCDVADGLEAEFIGKQLAVAPASWAGNDGPLSMKGAQRKFGIYVPNNAGYSGCAATMKQTAQVKYNVASNRFDEYQYALDITQAPTDSNKAITQFAADRDTTVVLLSDPIAPIFLTQAAQQQNYYPEWTITGVALTDGDNWAQLWEQQEVSGRLFGLSQQGSAAAINDPHGEAATALAAAGVPLNPSAVVDYFELIQIFDQLQAAGPALTPVNIRAGTRQLPEFGGASGASGTWHFGDTHTAIIDSREVYWVATQKSPANGQPGTYVEIYNGRRFRAGQFPSGQPPVYP